MTNHREEAERLLSRIYEPDLGAKNPHEVITQTLLAAIAHTLLAEKEPGHDEARTMLGKVPTEWAESRDRNSKAARDRGFREAVTIVSDIIARERRKGSGDWTIVNELELWAAQWGAGKPDDDD